MAYSFIHSFVCLGISNSFPSFRLGLDHDNSQTWNDGLSKSESYENN